MSQNPTKTNICETAYRLFKENGYDSTTVNDICDACGITKTTFYYHLKSKEEIILDFYSPVTQSIASQILQILSADNYWQQLVLCFNSLIVESEKLGYDLSSQLFVMNLKEDQGSFDMREDFSSICILLIEKAQSKGQIRNPNNAPLLYRSIAHTFLGFQVTWCLKKGEFDWKREMVAAMENLFDADPKLRVNEK